MGGWDPGGYATHIFSEGMYVEKNSTLYLGSQKEAKKGLPHSVSIKDIQKVEKRSFSLRFIFLEIKEGIRARQTLSGGLEFKVDSGPGITFELFNLSKEEYKIIKNYTALQNEQDAKNKI